MVTFFKENSMDKALFRAYVKELVNEQIEQSVEKAVKKILPDVLAEAIAEIKEMQPITESVIAAKPKMDRSKLAMLLGLERNGDTISATTKNMVTSIPNGLDINNPIVKPAVDAINRDYSGFMKKLGLTK